MIVSVSVQVVSDREALRVPALVGWHLLSLDAPTVAVVWTWFVARAAGVALPGLDLAAMFLAVWVLYAADRLLDARMPGAELEERHRFHQRYRVGFRWGIGVGCALLAGLLPRINGEEMKLYLVLGVALVGWFVAIHTGERPLPKEFVVGVFFAAAVFVPTVVRVPGLRHELVVPVVLVAVLCSLNCLFIFAWEHEDEVGQGVHASTRAAARWVIWLGWGVAVAGALVLRLSVVGEAVGLSAGLLVGLHGVRGRMERTTLRALGDLVLLTPLVVGMWGR